MGSEACILAARRRQFLYMFFSSLDFLTGIETFMIRRAHVDGLASVCACDRGQLLVRIKD